MLGAEGRMTRPKDLVRGFMGRGVGGQLKGGRGRWMGDQARLKGQTIHVRGVGDMSVAEQVKVDVEKDIEMRMEAVGMKKEGGIMQRADPSTGGGTTYLVLLEAKTMAFGGRKLLSGIKRSLIQRKIWAWNCK